MKRRRDGSASRSSTPWRRLTWIIVMATVSFPTAAAQSSVYVGRGAMTTITNVGHAGCGFVSWPAMAETQYAAIVDPPTLDGESHGTPAVATAAMTASACGRCAQVWRDGSPKEPEKTSTIVYIVEDQRSWWTTANDTNVNTSDLHLSPLVFQNLTELTSGPVPIHWEFVDCEFPEEPETEDSIPIADPVGCAVCARNDSSPYWLSLQPVNDTFGVASIRVNGVRATRSANSSSYFFNMVDYDGRLNISDLEISITTRDHRTFTRQVTMVPGSCMELRQSNQVVDGTATSPDGPGQVTPSPSNAQDDEITNGIRMPNNGGFIVVPTGRPSTPNDPLPASLTPLVVPGPGSSPLTPSMTIRPLVPPATARPLLPSLLPGAIGPIIPTTLQPSTGPASPWVASASVVPSPPNPLSPTASSFVNPSVPVQSVSSVPPFVKPIDKGDENPTKSPPTDSGIVGSGSGMRSKSPPQASRPADTYTPRPVTSPPQSTIEGKPVTRLSGGVLTNPLFVGLLLGTVGLVGAVVAYRAKARQSERLALIPSTSTSAVDIPVVTSRAMPSLSPRRTDFATL